MSELIKFPKIRDLKTCLRDIRKCHSGIEKFRFLGHTKLHGTNAGVRWTDGEITCQSRNNKVGDGHFGFVQAIKDNEHISVFCDYISMYYETKDFIIFGEWAGAGIQKKVAIAELPKSWYVFAIYDVEGDEWYYDLDKFVNDLTLRFGDVGIDFVNKYTRYYYELDINNVAEFATKVQQATLDVEKQCPVSFAKGVDGIGEGIVWSCVTYPGLIFKSKGQEHSKSPVKAMLSPEAAERELVYARLADEYVTADRLESAWSWMKEQKLPLDRSSTGKFIQYLVTDTLTEVEVSLAEEISATPDFVEKKLNAKMSEKARIWLFEQLDKLD